MNRASLSPDDLPPTKPTELDATLRRQLEEAITRRFYEACDGVTQALLCQYQWRITTEARALTLVIVCPDQAANWQILHNLEPLAKQLDRYSHHARIRVCPPAEMGSTFEIRVDEIAI